MSLPARSLNNRAATICAMHCPRPALGLSFFASTIATTGEVNIDCRLQKAACGTESGVADDGAAVGIGPASEKIVGKSEGTVGRARLSIDTREDLRDVIFQDEGEIELLNSSTRGELRNWGILGLGGRSGEGDWHAPSAVAFVQFDEKSVESRECNAAIGERCLGILDLEEDNAVRQFERVANSIAPLGWRDGWGEPMPLNFDVIRLGGWELDDEEQGQW